MARNRQLEAKVQDLADLVAAHFTYVEKRDEEVEGDPAVWEESFKDTILRWLEGVKGSSLDARVTHLFRNNWISDLNPLVRPAPAKDKVVRSEADRRLPKELRNMQEAVEKELAWWAYHVETSGLIDAPRKEGLDAARQIARLRQMLGGLRGLSDRIG